MARIWRIDLAFFAAFLMQASPLLAEEVNFKLLSEVAIQVLDQAQRQSFDEGLEYCGYIIEKDGMIFASPKVKGEEGSCLSSYPREDFAILASYHTHGSHNPDYDSEVPSVSDYYADSEDEIYGFVGTPGGRVWVIDPFQEEIFELCEGCILRDKNFDADDYGFVPDQFTPQELEEFLGVE